MLRIHRNSLIPFTSHYLFPSLFPQDFFYHFMACVMFLITGLWVLIGAYEERGTSIITAAVSIYLYLFWEKKESKDSVMERFIVQCSFHHSVLSSSFSDTCERTICYSINRNFFFPLLLSLKYIDRILQVLIVFTPSHAALFLCLFFSFLLLKRERRKR